MPVIALHLLLAIQLVGQDDALARIQARVPVEPIAAVPAELAGKYTTASEELSRRWGGGHLSGEELHLFSDGTYVYCEWADIEPLTVYDRGRWWVHSATLTLESSPDVTWDPGAERRYVVVGRRNLRDDAILVGVTQALAFFDEEPQDDPEFTLLLAGLLRTERYTANSSPRIKARLVKSAWRPDYFRRRK